MLASAVGDRVSTISARPARGSAFIIRRQRVLAPIVREKVYADSGVFVPRLARDYCLMWEAGPAGAMLDYRVRPRPATL
jgi:hypothetical protein